MKPLNTVGVGLSQQDFNDHNSRVLTNISFGSTTSNADGDMNMDVWKASGTTPGVANTEFSVSHGLGRVPFGFIVVNQNLAAHFFKSTSAWTSTNIFLKCDGISVAFTVIVL